MRIKSISDLIDGQVYWHLFVENDCHWQIKVKSSTYKHCENWNDMIVYDDECEAKAEANQIQTSINNLVIK